MLACECGATWLGFLFWDGPCDCDDCATVVEVDHAAETGCKGTVRRPRTDGEGR